jgi:hypothetical protein
MHGENIPYAYGFWFLVLVNVGLSAFFILSILTPVKKKVPHEKRAAHEQDIGRHNPFFPFSCAPFSTGKVVDGFSVNFGMISWEQMEAARSWVAVLFSAICLLVAGYLWFTQRNMDKKIRSRNKLRHGAQIA